MIGGQKNNIRDGQPLNSPAFSDLIGGNRIDPPAIPVAHKWPRSDDLRQVRLKQVQAGVLDPQRPATCNSALPVNEDVLVAGDAEPGLKKAQQERRLARPFAADNEDMTARMADRSAMNHRGFWKLISGQVKMEAVELGQKMIGSTFAQLTGRQHHLEKTVQAMHLY